jgi:prepilin-type processing-associated H-X9-DG protein
VVHRNEVPAEFAQAVDVERLPAVYALYADGHVEELVERSELARAEGSVEAFENLLLAKLSG